MGRGEKVQPLGRRLAGDLGPGLSGRGRALLAAAQADAGRAAGRAGDCGAGKWGPGGERAAAPSVRCGSGASRGRRGAGRPGAPAPAPGNRRAGSPITPPRPPRRLGARWGALSPRPLSSRPRRHCRPLGATPGLHPPRPWSPRSRRGRPANRAAGRARPGAVYPASGHHPDLQACGVWICGYGIAVQWRRQRRQGLVVLCPVFNLSLS